MPDQRTARKVADHVRSMVECSRLDVETTGVAVTYPIGATHLHPDDTPESFVGRSDQLMYQSKGEGSNRVSVG